MRVRPLKRSQLPLPQDTLTRIKAVNECPLYPQKLSLRQSTSMSACHPKPSMEQSAHSIGRPSERKAEVLHMAAQMESRSTRSRLKGTVSGSASVSSSRA